MAAGVASKLDGPDEPNELGPANPVELELPLLPASPGTDSLPHSRYLHVVIDHLNFSIILFLCVFQHAFHILYFRRFVFTLGHNLCVYIKV